MMAVLTDIQGVVQTMAAMMARQNASTTPPAAPTPVPPPPAPIVHPAPSSPPKEDASSVKISWDQEDPRDFLDEIEKI